MAQQPRVRDLLEEAILEGELKPASGCGRRRSRSASARRARRSARRCCSSKAQGLVEVEPNRGAVVRTFDRDDVLDLYEVRALLEPRRGRARRAAASRRRDIERLDALCADAPSRSRSSPTRRSTGSSSRRRAARGWRSRCARRPASRARSAASSGTTTASARSRCSAIAGSSARSAPRDAQLAEAVMRMHILGAVAFLEETWPKPLNGPARDRVRAAARRPVHRHAARGLRRRRDQDRGARRRRRDARLGPPAPQRPLAVVVDPRPQQALASRSTCASPRASGSPPSWPRRADIVLENFRPGTMEKWGLGPEDVHARNPRAIYARVSGYGQTGRYAHRPGFASAGEAISGLRYINGYPDQAPPRAGI